MNIRNATYKDAPAIKLLLEVLGYTTTISLLVDQLELLFGQNDHCVFVCETKKEIVGFIAVHYLPQLAFAGKLALISYLSVDESYGDQGVAKALEQYTVEQAIKRHCDRMQVHFLEGHMPARQFYKDQGYQEYPGFLTKLLVSVKTLNK